MSDETDRKNKDIKIMQIRAFCMVVALGSISQASHHLFRSQSAITRCIRDLEDTLSIPLFERQASGMLLTEMGKSVLPRAKRALAELHRIPTILSQLVPPNDNHREGVEPLWLFNIRRLQIFLSLYRLHSTQRVAKALGITQPAVSTALKVLEKGAGTALFKHTPTGMMPTASAREIAPGISLVLNELRHIPEDIAARQGMLMGEVHVGALPLCRTRLLPHAVIRLIARYPDIKVVTHEGMFDTMVTEMRAGDIDFIMGALRHEETTLYTHSEFLFEEGLTLLTRPSHPLVRRELQKTDLQNIQWILPRHNSPSRHLLEKEFHSMGIAAPQPIMESGDLAVIRAMLLESDMVAAVSSHQLDYEVSAGILTPLRIDLAGTSRPIGLMFRPGALHSPAAQALIQCIREVILENSK